jgi:hypothetical protein
LTNGPKKNAPSPSTKEIHTTNLGTRKNDDGILLLLIISKRTALVICCYFGILRAILFSKAEHFASPTYDKVLIAINTYKNEGSATF